MTLRGLLRELRDFPATTTFCLLWIVVFVALVGSHLAAGTYLSWTKLLFIGVGDGHRLGDLTLNDMGRGEYWRLVTSTFIHFSVIHLVLNLMAMYQLGTMVESWYGAPQFVFLYGLAAGGGNLVSVLIRHEIGSNPQVHSGGGSVVIMGLVGLCAVAGLRSRTKMGNSLGRIMVFFIVVTAAVGIALPRFIDNWGHAGGALVGAVLGFGHRAFLKTVNRPSALGRGVLTAILIAACGAAQALADRRETPIRNEQNLLRRVTLLERNYRVLTRAETLVRRRADGKSILKALDSLRADSEDVTLPAKEVRRLLALAESATVSPLSDADKREFRERLTRLGEQARLDYAAERRKLWQVRNDPRFRGLR